MKTVGFDQNNPAIAAITKFIAGDMDEFNERDFCDRAIAESTEAIRLANEKGLADDFPYFARGNAYYMKGDYERALADFTEASRLAPENAAYKEDIEDAKQQLVEKNAK